jgi:type IV pilus assembly protein PilB
MRPAPPDAESRPGVAALAEQLGLPSVALREFLLDPQALALVPESLARRLAVLPLFRVRDRLTVATANPANVAALDEVARAARCALDLVLAEPDEIAAALDGAYPPADAVGEALADRDLVERAAREAGRSEGGGAIVELVERLLGSAIAERASDLHLEPEADHLRVRLRVDGRLREAGRLPAGLHRGIVTRLKVLGGLDIADGLRPQDGRFRHGAADLRVSAFPTIHGEALVLRILDRGAGLLTLDQLGLAPAVRERYRRLIRRPHGLLLVTGPTGSGKTTTLYATLLALDAASRSVLTIEDPVEYQLPYVRQSQVNPRAGLTFAQGLRSLLRQDPDIIMVGEIRDAETARTAVQAALTGHLVLSTLHTNDAAGALARLTDIGLEPYLVASALIGILAQRLVRRLCHDCRGRMPWPAGIEGGGAAAIPVGCARCRGRGYRGRTGLFELLEMTAAVRGLALARAPAAAIRAEALREGMRPLRQDGLAKAVAGETSLEEVLAAAGDSEDPDPRPPAPDPGP